MERRIDAAAGKVDAIQHLLAVFGENLGWVAVELEGEPGVVLNSARDPEAWFDLIAKTPANGVALILRIGEVAGERFRGCGGVP